MALKRNPKNQRRSLIRYGWFLVGLGILLAGSNGAMAFIYRDRVLPNTFFGKVDVSGKPLQSLKTMPASNLLPAKLTFTKGADRTTVATNDFGIHVVISENLSSVDMARHWLPLLSFITRFNVPFQLQTEPVAFKRITALLAKTFTKPAIPEHISLIGTRFIISPASNGYALSATRLDASIAAAARSGSSIVVVPTDPIIASQHSVGLTSELPRLQHHLETQLSFVFRGQTLHPSATDIAGWFITNSQSMTPSAKAAQAYIDKLSRQFGATIANPLDLATAATYAVSKDQERSFAVIPSGTSTITRTYCMAVRGVDPSVLDDLTGKLAATYNDIRGWNNGGRIAFMQVENGCQYTVWVSDASQMSTFGAICDAYYNCQVGTNVILNYDRWSSGTDPWNKTGGSIEDYRTLMIDHETGHRLGFLDNPTCPGPGQPAPVMMQQSISLKGCTFNIWPRPAELVQLDTMLGLPAPSAVSE